MWCAAGSSGRNICLATRRSPSRRLPMAADFRTRSICPACSGVMSGRHRRVIGDASAGRPRDEVIGALSLKGIKSGIELRQDHEPDGVGLWRADLAPSGHAQCKRACDAERSEEHTSELQSLMRISYAVFCLKKKSNALAQKKRESTIKIRKKKE